MPDTNDFILTVTSPGGAVLYSGSYGNSPVALEVEPGTYTVEIASELFTVPAFDKPLYGDRKSVYVPAGHTVGVKLECTMQNSGVRIRRDAGFLQAYPGGIIYLKQGTSRLIYGYTEKRIAYFFPGELSVVLSDSGTETPLFTRELAPREILDVKLSAPSNTGGGSFSVSLDTTKIWTGLEWNMGSSSGEGGESAIGVADIKKHLGQNIWLYGYIVGGDLTSAGKEVKTSDITKATHLAIAARSTVTEKDACVAVELPTGKVREGLNLVSHPDLVGTRVYIKGNAVESYFGTYGLKGCTEYVLK